MRKDLTDVTVVMDRSGSMIQCREDAEGGLNAFIEEQKAHPGDCTFTLVQFDDEYEFVHKAVPIKDVPKCILQPRGWTALLDALGKAINETGERLAAMEEDERPSLVAFVVVTDGLENSSKEFTKSQIKEMIERQTNDYQWQFTFLGADQDAFEEAGGLGFSHDTTSNYAKGKEREAFTSAGLNLTAARSNKMAYGSNAVVSLAYSDEQRKNMA